MRRLVVVMLVLVGCGRFDFDALSDGSRAGDDDGAIADVMLTGDGASVAGWHLVQTHSITGGGAIAITPAVVGDIVVVAVQLTTSDSVLNVNDSMAVYQPATTMTTDTFGDGLQLWFTFADGPATAITVTLESAGIPASIVMWEFSGIAPAIPAQNAANSGSSAAPMSDMFPTTVVGELMVSAIIVENDATLVAGPFTLDHNDNDNGWVHLSSNGAIELHGAMDAERRRRLLQRDCAVDAIDPGI